MKISELRAGASNVTVTGKIVQKEEPREVVTKYGKRLNVANITLQDDSGSISMSLWGDTINEVDQGDTIEVSNAYVNEFRGNPQLSTGKFGKIKVIEKGDGSAGASSETPASPEEGSDEEM